MVRMAALRVCGCLAILLFSSMVACDTASAPEAAVDKAVAGEPAPKVGSMSESSEPQVTRAEKIIVQKWETASPAPAEASAAETEAQAPRSFEPKTPEFYRMINDLEHWRFNSSAVRIGAVPQVASITEFELVPDLSPSEVTKHSAGKYGTGKAYNYGEVLALVWKFYEAQRSGKLPSSNRIDWRGDSALNDKTPSGKDLTGGLYDAGDHLKLHFPLAFAAGILAQSVIENQAGYSSAGQNAAAMDTLRWIADYFMKAHYEDQKFTGQVGDPGQDHAFWGRPEDMKMDRPSWDITPDKPGSDLIGQVVGALAATAIVFKQTDPAYAAKLEQHARSLYELMKHEGKYSNSIDKAYVYPSSNVLDDMAWGSAWMYRLTKDKKYLEDAKTYRARNKKEEDGGGYLLYNWDSAPWGVDLVLAQLVPEDKSYSESIKRFLEAWLKGEGPIRYTPKGLAWGMEWGSLRHTANAAHIALLYAKAIKDSDPKNAARYACWARGQINYMLGDAGRSFVVGYGNNPPTKPHHRGSSCPRAKQLGVNDPVCDYSWFDKPEPNPQTLSGALVGGPGSDDSYDDRRQDYQKNEVAVDYNAGFTGALAALAGSDMNWLVCNQLGLNQAGPAPLSIMDGLELNWYPRGYRGEP
eukprot:jgi/Botrbrau1/18708/Bobra.0386s0034.1